jgi:hypothetical protein
MPVSALPVIAKLLGVSLEELVGEEPRAAKRGLRNPGHDGQDSELMADSIPE